MPLRPKKFFLALLFIAGSAAAPVAFSAGSSGGGMSSTPPTTSLTPAQQAAKALASGIRHRDRAWKQEARAAKATSDKKRARALAKAQTAYGKAVKAQSQALRLAPRNYKAANELGYALRKTGDFRKAIGAYNYALEINPDFHLAIEYRAEAFLAIGEYGHVQKAYMSLFRNDRALADQLMTAMDEWIAARGGNLGAPESAFVSWVEERRRLHTTTQDLSSNNTRSW